MPTYERAASATWRRFRAGAMVAVPGRAEPLQLNETAGVVWDLLQKPVEARSLARTLAATFARPEAEAALAVDQLLDELVACGAVVRR